MIDLTRPLHELIHELHATTDWQEGEQLEFKTAKGGFPKAAWSSCSAFANTRGGLLILGVDDKGEITGVDKPDAIIADFVNTANNPEKISLNIASNDDITTLTLKRQKIIVIRIRPARLEHKPVYINNNEIKCYRRLHEADQQCSDEQRYQMIRDKSPDSHDARIIENAGLQDLDSDSIQQYRNLMSATKPDHPWLAEDRQNFLERIAAYKRDRETGKEGITLAGLLMFGTYQALQELLSHYKVEYYELTEPTPHPDRWLDRVHMDGTWQPNLFQFFNRVRHKLTQDLRVPFSLTQGHRKDESWPHIALREALANALIHADYAAFGGIRIEKSPEGIMLRNAGTLLLSPEQIFQGGVSRCRNKTLLTMFMFIGFSEGAGSGVDKISRGWLDEYITAPRVEQKHDPLFVEWLLPYAGLAQRRVLDHIRTLLGEQEFARLDILQKIILLILPCDTWTARNELSSLLAVHPADVGRSLSKLVQAGHIATDGKSSATRYQKHARFLLEGDTVDVTPPFPVESALSDDPLFYALDESLQREILAYRKKKRQPRELTDDLILKIATDRWVTLLEFSRLLDRLTDVINRNVIQHLIRHGKLETKYSQKFHPSQAFRTIK